MASIGSLFKGDQLGVLSAMAVPLHCFQGGNPQYWSVWGIKSYLARCPYWMGVGIQASLPNHTMHYMGALHCWGQASFWSKDKIYYLNFLLWNWHAWKIRDQDWLLDPSPGTDRREPYIYIIVWPVHEAHTWSMLIFPELYKSKFANNSGVPIMGTVTTIAHSMHPQWWWPTPIYKLSHFTFQFPRAQSQLTMMSSREWPLSLLQMRSTVNYKLCRSRVDAIVNRRTAGYFNPSSHDVHACTPFVPRPSAFKRSSFSFRRCQEKLGKCWLQVSIERSLDVMLGSCHQIKWRNAQHTM